MQPAKADNVRRPNRPSSIQASRCHETCVAVTEEVIDRPGNEPLAGGAVEAATRSHGHVLGHGFGHVLQVALVAILLWSGSALAQIQKELVQPFEALHNHGSSLVETPDGGLMVAWFRGSGERKADDVAIVGAVRPAASSTWSERMDLADTPGFPDTNCTLLVDREGKLWLFYPTILANLWESALMKVKVAESWGDSGSPSWIREQVLHTKPGDDFRERVEAKANEYFRSIGLDPSALPKTTAGWHEQNLQMADDKLTRRLGWFTRPHPIQLRSGRILVGLYSDGFSFSMTTFSDNDGATWAMSEPMVGGGNVQPSLVELEDGRVLAFMRDNGPAPKKVLVSESTDGGASWSTVRDHPQLVDSGAGVDAVRLESGRILVVHNDVPNGRHQLALSMSEDDGATFRTLAYLEREPVGSGRYSYPSAIQGRNGTIHVSYSVHLPKTDDQPTERKAIRHAWFEEDWLLSQEDRATASEN